jgi:hypothetical protein
MLTKILIAIVGLFVAFCGVAAMQPDEYKVTRSAVISAAQADVFNHVNDFHKWAAWSPWEKLDPAMKKTFSGAESGAGAAYGWVGNSDVGEGRMTIASSQPAERIDIKLEFLKPFESTSQTVFTFKPVGNQTAVDWTMTGKNNFVSKAFGLLMGGMDGMVGPDFEKGLAQLKSVAESAAK